MNTYLKFLKENNIPTTGYDNYPFAGILHDYIMDANNITPIRSLLPQSLIFEMKRIYRPKSQRLAQKFTENSQVSPWVYRDIGGEQILLGVEQLDILENMNYEVMSPWALLNFKNDCTHITQRCIIRACDGLEYTLLRWFKTPISYIQTSGNSTLINEYTRVCLVNGNIDYLNQDSAMNFHITPEKFRDYLLEHTSDFMDFAESMKLEGIVYNPITEKFSVTSMGQLKYGEALNWRNRTF